MRTVESFHRADRLPALALALLALALASCRGEGQTRFFADQAYHFQTLRVLNSIRADGADVGEAASHPYPCRERRFPNAP
jgi:hypothetical protein